MKGLGPSCDCANQKGAKRHYGVRISWLCAWRSVETHPLGTCTMTITLATAPVHTLSPTQPPHILHHTDSYTSQNQRIQSRPATARGAISEKDLKLGRLQVEADTQGTPLCHLWRLPSCHPQCLGQRFTRYIFQFSFDKICT